VRSSWPHRNIWRHPIRIFGTATRHFQFSDVFPCVLASLRFLPHLHLLAVSTISSSRFSCQFFRRFNQVLSLAAFPSFLHPRSTLSAECVRIFQRTVAFKTSDYFNSNNFSSDLIYNSFGEKSIFFSILFIPFRIAVYFKRTRRDIKYTFSKFMQSYFRLVYVRRLMQRGVFTIPRTRR